MNYEQTPSLLPLLAIWTIYEKPTDHAAEFVARKWLVMQGGELLGTSEILCANDIDELRLQLPNGLTCFPRDDADVYGIVESWL